MRVYSILVVVALIVVALVVPTIIQLRRRRRRGSAYIAVSRLVDEKMRNKSKYLSNRVFNDIERQRYLEFIQRYSRVGSIEVKKKTVFSRIINGMLNRQARRAQARKAQVSELIKRRVVLPSVPRRHTKISDEEDDDHETI